MDAAFLSVCTAPFRENKEDENNELPIRRGQKFGYKRRVYCFSFCLAVIMFLMFMVNSILEFTNKLTENEQLWKFLDDLRKQDNATQVCEACPKFAPCLYTKTFRDEVLD